MGDIHIKVTDGVHQAIREAAEKDGRSLQNWIVWQLIKAIPGLKETK